MRPLNFVALLLFVAGLVWVFSLSEDMVRKIQKSYYTAISPFLQGGSSAEKYANNFIQKVETAEDLEKRLELAIRERDRFKLIASRVGELEIESNELRAALGFKQETEFDVVPARVVRRKPLTWSSTIQINRGENHGLGAALCVVASNGGLVGRIDLPVDEVSTVVLITDEASHVSARIEGTPHSGLLVGRRTNFGERPRLRLLYLDKNAIVSKGMKVYTDGQGKLFPPNIPIGTVSEFTRGPVYGEAEIIPAVDFTNLKTVFVITGSSEE